MPTELLPNVLNQNHPAEVRAGAVVDLFTPSIDQKFELGTKFTSRTGKIYRYARAGAANLVAGDLQQSALYGGAVTTYQQDIAVVVDAVTGAYPAIGDLKISATVTTTTQPINQFAGGYAIVSTGTGLGTMYHIESHAAGTGSGTIVLNLSSPIVAALASGSKLTLIANPYAATIQAPATTPTGVVVGVAPVTVTAYYYYWAQTGGYAACNVKTATTAGTAVVRDVAAAGSVGVQAAGASALATEVVGYTGWVTATTHIGLVYLTLDR